MIGIRTRSCRKAMPRTAIVRVFHDLSELAAEYGPDRIGLDVNIVIGGPGTIRRDGRGRRCADGSLRLDDRRRAWRQVDLNLHPYYAGSRGLARFPDHPRCSLATTVAGCHEDRRVGSIDGDVTHRSSSVGTTRAMTASASSDDLEIERARAAFDRFNQTNDPAALNGLESS